MACTELLAFRTAVENIDQRIRRSTHLGNKMFWRNLIPKAMFEKNKGITKSAITIKASEPTEDPDSWTDITLVDGNPSQCDTDYEDVDVGFYERTWTPKKKRFRGPVICKENFTYQHNPGAFINGYIEEMSNRLSREFEFAFRSDLMNLGNVYVDGTKVEGPNALATAPRAYQDISQSNLDDIATELINLGVNVDEGGYTTLGDNGIILPLYVDMNSSRKVLTTTSTTLENTRYAFPNELWKAIGANRVIGNFRHVPTNIAPRFNYTGDQYVRVTPFKTVTAMGTNGVQLTDEYKNAAFEAAIVAIPGVFTAEIVAPDGAGLNWEPSSYNGEWRFILGGERVCTPAVYDPEHEKGRHFAKIVYAVRPEKPFLGATYIYKRCATTRNQIFCS